MPGTRSGRTCNPARSRPSGLCDVWRCLMCARSTFQPGPLLAVLGVGLLIIGTVLHPMQADPAMAEAAFAEWAGLGAGFGIAGIAAAAALQAVDGVALKMMVDRWAVATEPEKSTLFAAAYGVRQIEIGLAGMSCLLLGLTAAIFGLALVIDGRFPKWAGLLGVAGGIFTAISGVVISTTGFSELAMTINMPAVVVLMAWLIALG